MAAIVAACMALVGVGVLFVRATHIERRWVVALPTLLGSFFAIYALAVKPVWAGAVDTTLPLLATAFSLFGFALGRLIDVMMGPAETIKHDQATYGADLAD